MNRRKSLQIMGAASAAGLLLPVPRLVALAQMMDGTGRIGEGDVTAARQTATDIATAYAAAPNGVARRAARAHALTLLGLLERASMSEDTRTGLTGVASDAAALHGYGHLDAGRLAEAKTWFAKALALARQADDRPREAYVLGSSALPLLLAPTPTQPNQAAGIESLEAAAGLQRFLPPAGLTWVFVYLAREHAALRDDLASGRFLEQARTAAARVRLDGPGWGFWSTRGELGFGCDSIRDESVAGLRLLRLGRPADAVGLFDAALDRMTVPVPRASTQTRVTEACVALGDPERACASAHAALDEADAYGLGFYHQKVHKVRGTFPFDWTLLAPVVELDDRLRAAA